jgi:hypothetical protein
VTHDPSSSTYYWEMACFKSVGTNFEFLDCNQFAYHVENSEKEKVIIMN